MKLRRLFPALAVLITPSLSSFMAAQTTSGKTAQPIVVMVQLAPLVYPPLARMARISGDVKLTVHIQPDGTVSSVDLFSGHPMLVPAAVANAKKSQFECKDCIGDATYELAYTFGFISDFTPYDKVEDRPARSAKCFFLWKCGVVQVHTFDLCSTNIPPQISQSPGHVAILAFPVCLETSDSLSASR
jgi:TonB family protein